MGRVLRGFNRRRDEPASERVIDVDLVTEIAVLAALTDDADHRFIDHRGAGPRLQV